MSAENHRQTLSALLDGETSELESRRLLRDLDEDSSRTWARWQLARDVMHGHQVSRVPEDFASQLCGDLGEQETAPGRSRFALALARMAVAASVALATVVGWQYWQGDATQPQVAFGEAPLARVLVNSELVSRDFEQPRPEVRATAVPLAGRDLEAMMVRHSDFAARHGVQGVVPYARFVSLEARQPQDNP